MNCDQNNLVPFCKKNKIKRNECGASQSKTLPGVHTNMLTNLCPPTRSSIFTLAQHVFVDVHVFVLMAGHPPSDCLNKQTASSTKRPNS